MSKVKISDSEGTFEWPQSIQMDLFNYLKPEQQEYIKPILRVLKKPAQEELCCTLLDYMESGEVIMSNNAVVDGMFIYLTRYSMPEEDRADDKRIIRPLHNRGSKFQGATFQGSTFQPMPIGEIINRFFPQFKK